MEFERIGDGQPENPGHRGWRRESWPLVLVLVGGIAVGWLGAAGCASRKTPPDFSLLNQAWSTIQKEYVDRSALQSKDLTYGAISGMVDALGDTGHSVFLTPGMANDLRHMERGELKGVGLEIHMKNGRVVVVAPIDGSPAQRAGIRPGEVILKVGGQDIADWPLNKVVDQISGRAGTKVTLTLQDPHGGGERELTLTRASIKLHEVTWCRIPGTSIAHLRLASFDAGVTRDLKRALLDIRAGGMNGIILDLRNNPGGLLDEAVSVASQFLAGGDVLVAKDAKGQTSPVPVEKGGLATNVPLVVLVNEGSASAAEIVAGALEDGKRADLVGETTFGTGTVLEEFRLADGSSLLLAVEEWLTPAGRSFWHKGLAPQFPVTLPPNADPLFPMTERDLTPEKLQQSEDHQLLTALRMLTNQAEQTAEDEAPKKARTLERR